MRVTCTRAGVLSGLQATAPLALPVAAYGSVFGMLANQAGVSALETTLLNTFVFAGAAQMAVMPYWDHPLPILSIAVVTFLINLRLVLLSASLRPWLKSLPAWVSYSMLFHVNDEAWSVSMMKYRLGERDAGVVLGSNIVVIIAWFPAAMMGWAVGGRIGDPARFGLDFAITAVFAAMLFSGYRSRRDIAPWIASAAAAILVWWLFPGTWYVVAGGIAGVAVAMLRTNDSRDQMPVSNPESGV